MTAPGPETLDRLRLVARWDGSLVQGALRTLAEVLDRLATWRVRLDGVGRALGDADCWSGPAADGAAAAVADLSRVAAGAQSAFVRSQEGWDALGAHAGAAQELALQALVLSAATEHPGLGWPLPGAAAAAVLAEEALTHATAAGLAARAAGDAVAGVVNLSWGVPAPTVPDLLARLGPLRVPTIPGGLSARDAAAWWTSLSVGEQDALIAGEPAAVGSLDGVAAWARDRANRRLLAQALEDPDLSADAARAAMLVDARIRSEEAAGRTVQLHLLDLDGDRVVLALGDLDTAESIALLVPGVLTTPGDDLGAMVGNARAVVTATEAAAPAATVAAVVWLGYRTPQRPRTMTGRTTAQAAGPVLAASLDGLAAARTAVGGAPARTTVLAHSYGTLVVGEAAEAAGRLAADAVVLLGSPGMTGDAASLEAAEVFDAGTAGDPISWAGCYGLPAGAPAYGSTGLPSDTWAGHSEYYEPDHPTLAAIGEVVAGVRNPD